MYRKKEELFVILLLCCWFIRIRIHRSWSRCYWIFWVYRVFLFNWFFWLNWFWCFLPIVGWIMLIVWYARPGVDGANQYGPDPKNPDVVYTQEERPPWEN